MDNNAKEPFLMGKSANVRLALYNRYCEDRRIAKQAWKDTLAKLRQPEYFKHSEEEIIAEYEKDKERLTKESNTQRIDGLVKMFDKTHNL